jgi:hypothetical protein
VRVVASIVKVFGQVALHCHPQVRLLSKGTWELGMDVEIGVPHVNQRKEILSGIMDLKLLSKNV